MPSLYLRAVDPRWRPAETGELLRLLDALGLLVAQDLVTDDRLSPGDAFLKLVMFLGCSPSVTLEPAADGQSSCYLRLLLFDEVRFLCARPPPVVRCPRCRARAAVAEPHRYGQVFLCPACGHEHAVEDLDWRRAAAFGRCFIEIGGVFPHEAVPADRLLERLEGFSACRWDYFYA
ncbi:MAG TPA: hypothetical protein ENK05_11015 [Gammaproteobacteria bacterium]|nr:hypothetical protein [Gammaproteobacteria bacterium]